MPIHGKFTVNNAEFSPLRIYGVGTFSAFSGNDQHRNKTSSIAIQDNGPIPPGLYFIVARPTGGWKGMIRTDLHDFYSWFTSTPVNKYLWFALYRADGSIDDYTWINGVKRGNFRLHPSGPLGISLGCITLKNSSDFVAIRQAITGTPTVQLPNGLQSYGTIEVILDDSTKAPGGR